MTIAPAILRKALLVAVASYLILGISGCRRGAKNTNANLSPSAGSESESERSSHEQSLIDQGKEFYKNDQDQQAVAAFQKALQLDPNDSRASDGLENAQEGAQRIREGKKHAEEMLKKQQNANANGNMNSNSSAKPTPKRIPSKPM